MFELINKLTQLLEFELIDRFENGLIICVLPSNHMITAVRKILTIKFVSFFDIFIKNIFCILEPLSDFKFVCFLKNSIELAFPI